MNKRNALQKKEPELLGWLVFRPDTDEFVYAQKSKGHALLTGYVKEPSMAFCYSSEDSAELAAAAIDRLTQVVPLFDFGDQLAVGFPED